MSTWHSDGFFGMHYDLHARETDTELGARLTPEHLREQLEKVRPDWIQCDCKGHPGWTSWPTDIGSTSPGVVADSLRIHRDVTRELGIRLGMHYSGVIDQRIADLHPEWAQLDAQGNPDPHGALCRLSPYLTEFLIPHMLEIVDKYDVDGFWVDGENWACRPCWCERCREAFVAKTGAVPTEPGDDHWAEWLAFHRKAFLDYVRAYADAVHARKPDCAVCSNWLYTLRTPDPVEVPVDYLSGDYVLDYGADRAALEGRVLDSRPLSWDLMAWAFSSSSRLAHVEHIYQVKPAVHLKQEVSVVVALGGAVMLYVQPMRDGRLVAWHHDTFAEIADFCRERKEVCFQSQSVPQAAILHPATSYYAENDPLFNFGHAHEPIEGALRALLETHRSADILTASDALARMGDYALIVVPERKHLGEDLETALLNFAQEGGKVLMTGAHLAEETPALVGADPTDAEPPTEVRFEIDGQAVRLGGAWRDVAPRKRTEPLTRRLWSDEPADIVEDGIVVTRRAIGKKGGAIVAVHGDLFRSYFVRSYPLIRRWIARLVADIGAGWALDVEHAPPWLEFVMRRKNDRLLVNLLNRGASETLSPSRPILEAIEPVRDVRFRVRLDKAPGQVTLAPSGAKIEWSHTGGWCHVTVPEVAIHEIVVFG